MSIAVRSDGKDKGLFDYSIKEELSYLLQSTKAFKANKDWNRQFSFACVVQDRLSDAISYLNTHLNPPLNNEEFYLFMVYADNVFSAINEFFDIGIIKDNVLYRFSPKNKDVNQLSFFLETFQKAFPKAPKDKWPSDDKFFKYLRSLSLAHPYETSSQPFIDKAGGERHYSPFPIMRDNPGFPIGEDGDIAIRVYSNCEGNGVSSSYFTITLRYLTIRDFLISRYNTLADIISYIKGLLDKKEKSWLEVKIDRDKPLPELFEQFFSIYKERVEDSYDIEELIRYMETPLTPGYVKNEDVVGKYKTALKALIPLICDAIEQGDYNNITKSIHSIISAEIPDWPECPDNGYRGLNYHYGKVTSICAEGSDIYIYRMTADLDMVMKGYAAKWVEINPNVMSRDEILLLLSAARWMESEECRRKGMLLRKSFYMFFPHPKGNRQIENTTENVSSLVDTVE